MYKIGIYIDDYTNLGGVERVTSNLITLLRNSFDVTTLISLHKKNTSSSINYPSINIFVLNRLTERKLQSIIISERLTHMIIQVQNLPDSYFVASVGKRNGCQVIPILHTSPYYYIKKYGTIYERFSSFRSCAQNLKMWLYWRVKHRHVFQLFLDNIGKMFFVSHQALQEFALLANIRDDDSRLQFIYNPIYLDEPLGLSNEKENCLLFAGRLCFEKKPFVMLRTWKILQNRYPSWKFFIMGEGPLRMDMEKYISRHKIKNVFLCGAVKNPGLYMAKSKIVLLCSYYEGLPTVLLEASLYRNVLVATKGDGGVCDIIQDGVNGILLPSDDETSLVHNLDRIMRNDSLLNEMGLNASHIVAEKFSHKAILKQWESILCSN